MRFQDFPAIWLVSALWVGLKNFLFSGINIAKFSSFMNYRNAVCDPSSFLISITALISSSNQFGDDIMHNEYCMLVFGFALDVDIMCS